MGTSQLSLVECRRASAALTREGGLAGAFPLSGIETAAGEARAFRASENFLTVLDGRGTQRIRLKNPGRPDGDFSFFGTLEVANSGDGVLLLSDVVATGVLVVPAGNGSAISGEAHTLTVAGVDVDDLTLERTGLVEEAGHGSVMRFHNVTFHGYASTDPSQLTLSHPGAAEPFTFDDIRFDTNGPDGESTFLVVAADTDPADDAVFTVLLVNTVPTDGTHLTSTDGAVVTWADMPDLPEGATVGWTGADGTAWSSADHWHPLGVPGAVDVVHLPAAAGSQPVLAANATVRGVIIEDGATVDIGVFDLTVAGDVDAGATVVGTTGRVIMTVNGTFAPAAGQLHHGWPGDLAVDHAGRERGAAERGRCQLQWQRDLRPSHRGPP